MPPKATDSIFTSCKRGDIQRIKYLVETKEVDLNVRDCWDSTPLYYACHCGHLPVVQYLLANGARCEANTFDGERCLYGALTIQIKQLILNSKLVNTVGKRRDDFDEFCEKMMKAEEFSDMKVYVQNKEFKVHRCLMASRSEYFSKSVNSTWKTRNIRTDAFPAEAFDEFVKFLYTGRLTCDVEQCEDLFKLSNKCGVSNFNEHLKKAKKESEYFEMTKKRVKISTLIVDSPSSRRDLREDFGALIDPGMPEKFLQTEFYRFKWIAREIELKGSETDPIFDLCLVVDGHRFHCNKLFVCTRSEYFAALLQDHFQESGQENGTPVITLRNVTGPVLACVLYYIYTNTPTSLDESIVLDVLEAAAIYLLPGLKKLCASHLCTLISLDNIIDFLNIARMHDLPKLEDNCAAFIGLNIETVVMSEDFRKFVSNDANEVKGRQETDSIPIIDDIRYHISSEVGTFSEVKEAQEKLKLIDNLLDDLGLDA